jgi:phage gp16-like protein
MTSSIAAIHVAQKQLGLDDDTYRAKLTKITGKGSVKDMSEDERQKVLTVFRNEGFAPKGAARRPNGKTVLSGKFVKKCQALWIAGYNLGIVRDRDDAAMCAFILRQTGIESAQWLHHADDARKVIEALKKWLQREAGVSFGNLNGQDWLIRDGAKIAWAQWKLLTPGASLIVRKGFDDEVRKIRPHRPR